MDTLPPLSGQVSIESLASQQVACYATVSKEPETEGRYYLNSWLARQQIGALSRYFGFDIDVTAEQKNSGLRGYEVWATVPEDVKPSDGVEINHFAGGLYASVLLLNPFDDPYRNIPLAWKALHEWVISSDAYRGANHQWLEELFLIPTGNNLKLYYPVKPTGVTAH